MCITKHELLNRIINLQDMCMDYEIRLAKLEKEVFKPLKKAKVAKKGTK